MKAVLKSSVVFEPKCFINGMQVSMLRKKDRYYFEFYDVNKSKSRKLRTTKRNMLKIMENLRGMNPYDFDYAYVLIKAYEEEEFYK